MRQRPDPFASSGVASLIDRQRPSQAVSRDGDAPLAALAGSHLAGRFRHWRGLSGRRYLFSVFPLTSPRSLERLPRYEQTVILAIRRDQDGTRTVLLATDTGSIPEVVFGGHVLRHSIALGANEIHMHLLADDGESRRAIVDDFATS